MYLVIILISLKRFVKINYIMKISLVFLAIILIHLVTQGQDLNTKDKIPVRRNTFFAEALGNGGNYSINYDRLIGKNNPVTSIRLGLIGKVNYESSSIPVEFNLLFGSIAHKVELGLGFTGIFDNFDFEKMLMFFRCGYRYQLREGGLFFRVGITPYITIINIENGNKLRLWGGLGVGYTF